MGVPIPAVVAGVGSFIQKREAARIESHIQDRVKTYSTFTDEKLRAIIQTYPGGEMAEAANRVLSTRMTPGQGIGAKLEQAAVALPGPVEAIQKNQGWAILILLAVAAFALFRFRGR